MADKSSSCIFTLPDSSTQRQRTDIDIHRAAEVGDAIQLSQYFCCGNGGDCDTPNKDLHTPLYLACREGHVDCIRVLMNHNAKLKYEAGGKWFSCLYAAIDANKREVLAYILSLPKEKWIHGFRFCSECDDKDGNSKNNKEEEISPLRKLIKKMPGFRFCSECDDGNNKEEEISPLRKLIKKMPDMAKVVFDKFCKRDSVSADYFYREVLYDYELLEDYQDLYQEFLERDQVSDSDTAAQKSGGSQENVQERYNWGPKQYRYHTHPLYLMVRYRRKDLLAHELVSSFICMRWNIFLKYIYYFNLLTYIVLMLLLTVYMHVYFLYANEFAELTNQTITNCSDDFEQELDDDILGSRFPFMRTLLIFSSVIISAICLFRLVTELFQMITNGKRYFTEFLNYAEVFLYVSTIVFVANAEFSCLSSWRWQLGAFCIFVSWLNFVFFLSLQPNLGIYVIMFEEIIATFLKVLPLAVLLILAFGQPFFILLGPIIVQSDPTTRPFSSLHYSLMKTLTMMIGEFETDPLLYSVPSILLFPVATYFLWIVFVLVVSILLQNLLVGLAVDNIKGIRKQAEFKRQVAQIKVLLTLMSPRPLKKLFGFCLRRHAKEGPKEYKKSKGKLHRSFSTYLKHKSGSLVNFSWKPEDVPMELSAKHESVRRHSEGQQLLVQEKLEQISRELHTISKEIQSLKKKTE